MIRKLKSLNLLEILAYFVGRDPVDEWEFQVGSHTCRVVNGYRSGASLLVDGERVARTNQKFALRLGKPALTAEVAEDGAAPRRVDIYVRAFSSVKIQVRIDGDAIQNDFV